MDFCGEMCDSMQSWGAKRGGGIKKEVLKHLQSDLARAYRDYNVISGVGV